MAIFGLEMSGAKGKSRTDTGSHRSEVRELANLPGSWRRALDPGTGRENPESTGEINLSEDE